MNATAMSPGLSFRPQLLDRRARLQAARGTVSEPYLNDLIAEIDSALGRIDNGSFGTCETCHDPIEADRLESNPLVRFCLDHLSPAELTAHQQDLDLATQIQSKLLPPCDIALADWEAEYRYRPVGAVGGDYCDLIPSGDGRALFFAVGDVAGKGVAASLLMTHLNAIFRSLLSLDLPLAEVVSRANRLFCESTGPAHYATLACGRVTAEGVELCNAGHCRPLHLQRDAVDGLDPTGLPLGLFCGSSYTVRNVCLDSGESLVLYSDGITEAVNAEGEEFQEERLVQSLRAHAGGNAASMADGILRDVAQFRQQSPQGDDVTLLIVRRRE